MLEYFEPAGLHPIEHVHKTGFHTHAAIGEFRVLVQ
jgi:hypothetical protein